MSNKKQYRFEMGGKGVLLSCEEHLEKELEFFARVLEREELDAEILQDDKIVQIGFFFYKITREQKSGQTYYRVSAFDIATNPFEKVTEDLTLSLDIFSKQNRAIKIAGVQPCQVDFQQTLILHKDAWISKSVYLEHCEPADEYDSGWYMGPLHGEASNNPGDYKKIYVFQLLNILQEALTIMLFPQGTMAIYEDGRLVQAVDENNRKLL